MRRLRGVVVALAAAWSLAAGAAGLKPHATPESGVAQALRLANGSPTFASDVAPIIYGHCTVCHRPGQAGPFPLTSYDEVKRRGDLIVSATGRRYMPPWHATPAAGFPEFRGNRRLRDADIATLKAWAAAGMPAGDLGKAPRPPTFPDGWTLGRPSLELALAREIEVPADGPDLYRNIVLPVDLPVDRWITATDFVSSAPKAIHHALFFVTSAAESATIQNDDVLPGFGVDAPAGLGRGRGFRAGFRQGGLNAGIGGWVPGMTPHFLPGGIAQRLPAHSNIVVQMHLHPSGKNERVRGQMALYFAQARPAKSLVSLVVPPLFGFAMGLDIPTGAKRYQLKDSFVLPVDVEAFGARGHAHYLAREMKMMAALPDGSTKGLLWISDWDLGWQDSYFYKVPFVLPKGTRLDVEIAYDNSAENLRNPNTPPKPVKWGLASSDEMGGMSLLVTAPSVAEEDTLRQAQAQHFRRQVAAMFLRR